jgi:D-aminopeptidase
LNDIRGQHVTREHVTAAMTNARSGAVEEGAVGAGTGTIAFGWKGGIGTSSRTVRAGGETWTIGVLVQSNYGGKLVIDGVPVWKELNPRPDRSRLPDPPISRFPDSPISRFPDSPISRFPDADGSCMIVVATDAPVDAKALQRIAARAIFAMARTGSTYSNGSGDFAIAFSTHASQRVTAAAGPQPRTAIPTDGLSGLFEATLDATEEALVNSLLKAADTSGNGRTVPALPVEPLRALLRRFGRGIQ